MSTNMIIFPAYMDLYQMGRNSACYDSYENFREWVQSDYILGVN